MILLTQMFIITESELLAAALRYRITSPKSDRSPYIPKQRSHPHIPNKRTACSSASSLRDALAFAIASPTSPKKRYLR